jgi:magnesium transporter
VETLARIDKGRIEQLLARDEFFWLDVESPSDDELDTLAQLLEWHPLAVEDAKEFGQRPKLDTYRSHALLVFYGVNEPDRRTAEVHLFVSGGSLVTVRRAPCARLEGLHEDLEPPPPRTEESLVYRVLDALTDSFFPVLDEADEDIERLEDAIIASPDRGQLARVVELRRRLGPMRRVALDQSDMFADVRTVLEDLPGLERDPQSEDRFRDISDHLQRMSEVLDAARDRLTAALELYATTNSNRLNEVIERLTVISIVFLPLTFLVGFFGQNFGWMERHINSFADFLIWGVGGMLACVALTVLLFRRAGVLEDR